MRVVAKAAVSEEYRELSWGQEGSLQEDGYMYMYG